nr:uncharacterized protein c25h2.10c [Quercus suber]
MNHGSKRKAEFDHDKRAKTKKQWRVPRKGDNSATQPTAKVIEPGDSGIWATCNKGKEGKCIGELRDLFAEYADEMYGEELAAATTTASKTDDDNNDDVEDDNASLDIESEIKAEVDGLQRPRTKQLFTPVRIDVQCVVFFRTVSPVEPVSFVKRVCEDALREPHRKRTRFAKRLSPMTLMGRASAEGLEKVARQVLAPHFHQDEFVARKFAIRPTLRNHNVLTRDSVIKQVASLVGPGHAVDLKNYDLLIVVEVYQNICGMSVLDNSFERLKRLNLAEIFDPTMVDDTKQKEEPLALREATDSVANKVES